MKFIDKNRIVKKGQTIYEEKPFVFILNSKFRSLRCDYCFKRGKLLKCSGCHYVMYCDRDCQRSAWLDHKGECPNIKKVAPRIIPDAARILARIILKLKRGGSMEKSYYTKTSFRMFKDLMSHYPDIKQDPKRLEHFESLYRVLQDYIGDLILPNAAELLGIYGRLVVNGFNILDSEMSNIGTGIYLGSSIMNHSCEPTAIAIFEGTTICIRALVDFPVFDWSKVLISYVDLMNSTNNRQQELLETYYFLCECNRCKDIEENLIVNAMMCPGSDCSSPIKVSKDAVSEENFNLSCPACKENIKKDRCKAFLEVTDFVQLQIENMKDVAYLDVCRVCLKKQEGLFYDLNLSRVKVLDLAFDSCIQLNQWEDARFYGPQLIPGYRKYYGANHPLLGVLLLKLGKINTYLGHYQEACGYMKTAEQILLVTHGSQHSLYKEELLPVMIDIKNELQARSSN